MVARRTIGPIVSDVPYAYQAVNVEAQERTSTSLLRWMRRTIQVRGKSRAFGRGTFEPLHPANRKVLVFLRRWQEEVILCVEGRITLMCGEHVVSLEAGDSCHFDGRVPHSIENPGDVNARVFIALTPAVAETKLRSRGESTNGHTVDTAMLDSVG